jgi:hypothetical protein
MAFENITLRKQNVTMVDGYFYMIDEEQDVLIVKTDDGTQAYSYPLDTTISNEVVSLEYDGYNFWSLENPNGTDIIIRRWNIENYVLQLRNTFEKLGDGSYTWDSTAMTIQHYHLEFSGNEPAGQAALSVTTGGNFDLPTELSSGMTAYLGPNSSGQMEAISVNSVGANVINVNGTTTYAYQTGDPISFYSRIWLFNNFDGIDNSTGALYQLNAYTGAYQAKYAGGEYQDVLACTFFDMSPTFGAGSNSIAYIKATNMIFLDPNDLNNSFGSMTMDNLHEDQDETLPVFDVTIEGVNVYRLQLRATYYGTTYIFAGSNYSYQLSTLEPFITSISLRVNPAILPADGASKSTITAIVRDQFNRPISGKSVYFTDDDPDGEILPPNPKTTDANGEASTQYQAGNEAREVKITATAEQG